MTTKENPDRADTEKGEPEAEVRGAAAEDYVPLSVRNARHVRRPVAIDMDVVCVHPYSCCRPGDP
jgi:hypothetical protein